MKDAIKMMESKMKPESIKKSDALAEQEIMTIKLEQLSIVKRIVDTDGKITRWPKKKEEKMEVLRYLNSKIDRNKIYTEKEVNNIIKQWHTFNDYALLRRELYDNFLLERTDDCRKYWIEEKID